MEKIGIIYGTAKGSTEKVAFKVAKALGEDIAEMLPVKDVTEENIKRFIVLGHLIILKNTIQIKGES